MGAPLSISPRPDVDIRVLGTLEIRRAGQPMRVPGAKPRALLTMLGLHAGRTVPAADLQALLWGDAPPTTAHKALLTHISALRRVLGDDAVVTTGNGWRLGTDETDATRFDMLACRGREATSAGSPATAAEHFGAALHEWRACPDLPGTTLGAAETTRWAERHDAVVDDRHDALLSAGHAADLISDLEAAVAAAPLRERRWAQLCLALYRCGRQGDALRAYRRARDVLADELGVEPGPQLRAMETAILAQDPTLETASRPPAPTPAVGQAPTGPALPAPATSFIGRADELAQLENVLATHRMVSVVGPGGVGKTRLALAVTSRVAHDFPGGVTFVDLVPSTPEFVTHTVAAALGVSGAARPELAIRARLSQGRCLLVLDNCEHVVDAVGELITGLLPACPDAVVLATSRERLGVAGERVFTAPPLSLVHPQTGHTLGSDAHQLFLDRAGAVATEPAAPPDVIGEICARLDGLPLAIELVAARFGALGADGLLAGLDDRLGLASGARAAECRHRSLRAVLDWSHELLAHDERVCFRRLSVFLGGFDVAAARAVVGDTGLGDVVDTVGRLTDKSLLVRDTGPEGSHWRMLGTVRSYAWERLGAADEEELIRARHHAWAAATAQQLDRRLSDGQAWHEAFDGVADDLWSALTDTSVDVPTEQRLALALAVANLQARRGSFTFAQAAYEQAMARARETGEPEQLARAALGASETGLLFGVNRASRVALLEEALAALVPAPSEVRVRLLARLAIELYWSPAPQRSVALAREAAELAEKVGGDGARAAAWLALHYVERGPDTAPAHPSLAADVVDLAERAGDAQTALAGRAARVVELLDAGDLDGMRAEVDTLGSAADRHDHPAFRWYASVYRLVMALLHGRFTEADALAADARTSARHAPEFSVGLRFAEVITDVRPVDAAARQHRGAQMARMAERYPGVFVWRCLQLLDEAALGHVRSAQDASRTIGAELLHQTPRSSHWLVGCCLLAEVVAVTRDTELAVPLEQALRPFAGRLAVAGRVGAFRGSVSHHLGLLGELIGSPTEQVAADLRTALQQHDGIGARPFAARDQAALSRLNQRSAG